MGRDRICLASSQEEMRPRTHRGAAVRGHSEETCRPHARDQSCRHLMSGPGLQTVRRKAPVNIRVARCHGSPTNQGLPTCHPLLGDW